MSATRKGSTQMHELIKSTKKNSDIAYMDKELSTIASWVNYKDSRDVL